MGKLKDGLIGLNIPQEYLETVKEILSRYIDELELFNSSYDLVGATTREEIEVRHILDSLSAWKSVFDLIEKCSVSFENSQKVHICDVGSGAGLPGIPLSVLFSILFPEKVKFTLIERMSRRCAFLENCIALLGLKNVTVLNSELERVEKNFTDIAVFRAFKPLDKKMIKNLLKIVKNDGFLAAYKAKFDKIAEEMSTISTIVPYYTVNNLFVPFLENTERNLVIIKK
ncbi:MAG: 16S rRNA (guanine(527)-N(7))-methyltransferase RsmG [Treponema sp.]|nr:16S rRNA (guanine(527)-N(7))-methyltransferase RsmG [Treponema sp.]